MEGKPEVRDLASFCIIRLLKDRHLTASMELGFEALDGVTMVASSPMYASIVSQFHFTESVAPGAIASHWALTYSKSSMMRTFMPTLRSS